MDFFYRKHTEPIIELSNPKVGEIEEIEEEVEKKFRLFKRFDVVSNAFPDDHHFFSWQYLAKRKNDSFQKMITEERKILEENLPNSIVVRAYEEHMDLMRAVIVGLRDTPYHNCLFVFDMQLPSDYPKSPPKLYYYSHDLSLNPNLHANGDVDLWLGSVLKKAVALWNGSVLRIKWIPGKTTILDCLVSIQELVLNGNPYSNRSINKVTSKDVMMKSYKAMLYKLRNPPKHFRDFVVGHFRKRSHDILMSCKDCMHDDEGYRIFMELLKAFEANGSYCKHFYCHKKKEKTVAPIQFSDQEETKDNGYGKIFSNLITNSFCA